MKISRNKLSFGGETPDGYVQAPTSDQISEELERVKYGQSYMRALRGTVYTLITVAAVAVLVAVLFLPVLRIFGTSMDPTLMEGDIVVSVKYSKFKQGDIVAFYYNNKILVKRMVAGPGDWVDISPDGTIFVNGKELIEPYVFNKAFGETDIKLPYQVPDARIFVVGDHRDVSIDSRNTAVGCVAEEQVVGRIVYRVWPLSGFGKLTIE